MFEMLVIVGYLVGRSSDFLVHLRHYKALRIFEYQERAIGLMRVFYVLDVMLPFILLGYMEWHGQAEVSSNALLTAVVLLSVGFSLRVWAIMSLGSVWTMRCLSLSGVQPLKVGPFRFLKHPEYCARLIEAMGLAGCLRVPSIIPYIIVSYMVLIALLVRNESQLLKGQTSYMSNLQSKSS